MLVVSLTSSKMSLLSKGLRNLVRLSDTSLRPLAALTLQVPNGSKDFHTCAVLYRKPLSTMPKEPVNWPKYNDIVYPPQKDGEPPRPAEIVHCKPNVRYSQHKMWYLAYMIRGMSVDEALKQLSFVQRKGGAIIKQAIEEAIEMAVKDHNVEFRSNLWISDSFVAKGARTKGFRKNHFKGYSVINYTYTHYYVRLREGKPPKHYFPPNPTGHQKMADYIEELRSRQIRKAL